MAQTGQSRSLPSPAGSRSVFDQNSLISLSFADKTFAKSDLSNVSSFFIESIVFEDRMDLDIVSRSNFDGEMNSFYDMDTTHINDQLKVFLASGHNAVNFLKMHEIIFTFLSKFYGDRLRLFIHDYTGMGELEALIAHIEDKIREIMENFVLIDECELPLNNIDEGCAIKCDNLHLEEPHLMLSKQKLKSLVRCLFECDTMPYTEDDLAGRVIPLVYQSKPVASPPPEPTL